MVAKKKFCNPFYSAMRSPAPATAAAAYEPRVFLDAAPVKFGPLPVLVPVGVTGEVGTMGEPVAAAEVATPDDPIVPVAKPVEAALGAEELIIEVFVQEHSVS